MTTNQMPHRPAWPCMRLAPPPPGVCGTCWFHGGRPVVGVPLRWNGHLVGRGPWRVYWYCLKHVTEGERQGAAFTPATVDDVQQALDHYNTRRADAVEVRAFLQGI
jgi:hypothetical protein